MALQKGNWGSFTTISGVITQLINARAPYCTLRACFPYLWVLHRFDLEHMAREKNQAYVLLDQDRAGNLYVKL